MAADISTRVHLVAEKLQQRAHDAQLKGNETAARALSASVSDLRQALALISEQRHLLARRHGESDNDEDDDVKKLATQLARVQAMLSKKFEDMRAKGNETASTALQQAAETVAQGRSRVLEQQQTIFGLLERWKRLESIVVLKARENKSDETLLDRVQRLVELEHGVLAVWPEYQMMEGNEARTWWQEQALAMEKGQTHEVERRDALLEQQCEACQAMEQLVRESDQEIQAVRRQTANEMQTLRLERESLSLEIERLKSVHTNEVEELQMQLTCAMDAMATKEEKDEARTMERATAMIKVKEDTIRPNQEGEKAVYCGLNDSITDSGNGKRMTTDAVTWQGANGLVTSSSVDNVAELRQAWIDEMIEVSSPRESTVASLSSREGNKCCKWEQVQAIRSEVHELMRLEQVQADRLEQLRQAHLVEVEALRLQLDRSSADGSWHTTVAGHEVQHLQAKLGVLAKEKNRLVQEHGDSIETLSHQLNVVKATSDSTDRVGVLDKGNGGSKANREIPVLELDEGASNALTMPFKTEGGSIGSSPHKAPCHGQQSPRVSLENEQMELEDPVKPWLTQDTALTGTVQRTHGEDTTGFTLRNVDKEQTIDALSTQVKELEKALAAKGAEQTEAVALLEHWQAALKGSHGELAARVRKCTELQSALLASQETEEKAALDVAQVKKELREMVSIVRKNKEDLEAVAGSSASTWQCQEAVQVYDELASLVSNLVAVQDQLQSTVERLNEVESERDRHKRSLHEFVKWSNWQLFATEGDDAEQVGRRVTSDTDFDNLLTIARANCEQWVHELQQLRNGMETDTLKLQELEKATMRFQAQCEGTEAARRELKARNEALNEQVAALQRDKADMTEAMEKRKAVNQSASIHEQHQQAAQQQTVVELQHCLASVQSDFERYRVRSHTALKKMEKRAELLNGMRKANEALVTQVQQSSELREQADAAHRESERRLNEVQRTHEMMQAELDQLVLDKARVVAKLEDATQRLVVEREERDATVNERTLAIEKLLLQKQQMKDESERAKEAEHAVYQAHLNSARAAVQTAKQDLQTVHDALEACKAECDKRQRRIETLEQELKAQVNASICDGNRMRSVAAAGVSLAPSVDLKQIAGLEKERTVLRASETALRQQLDNARAELTGLQECLVTTKAAHAEQVFALEEKSREKELELAAATEEVGRLTTKIESLGRTFSKNGASCLTLNEDTTEESAAKVWQLRCELQDATTEIALLTRALDACQDERQEARDPVSTVASSESGEESRAVAQMSTVLHAKDDALKKLRTQALALQEELQTLREDKTMRELKVEQDELDKLRATRKHMQSEKARALQAQRWQTLVSSFKQQVATIKNELQTQLEEHSSAFRRVCDFRDNYQAVHITNDTVDADTELEECLVMRSGVVIKAGTNFQLPVICEQRGWRVVWSFSIKEEEADVVFKLIAKTTDAATLTEVDIVSPERMHDMAGVFHVHQDTTTLVFEWDNAFSWLNEKTLDYHVSVQEPLPVLVQQTRRTARDLKTRAKQITDGLALIQEEAHRRSELTATLQRLNACEAIKETHGTELIACRAAVMKQKTQFQNDMEGMKAEFAVLLAEQDKVEDVERKLTSVWDEAMAERQDVEMTLQLAGNGAQIETLAQALKDEMKKGGMEEGIVPRDDDSA